jgi:site-specific recombinase XerD
LECSGHEIPFRVNGIKIPYPRDNEQDHITLEEFEQLINHLPNTFYGLRDRVLYELLWSTGLRIGEALGMDIKDIDFKTKEIKVKTFKQGEGEKVYISEQLEYWLKKWLELRRDANPALFVTYHQDILRLTRCSSGNALLNYRKELGWTRKITHHAFRRGFCTYVLNNGANIKEVQYLARHRSERTTLRFYAKVTQGRVKDVHQNIFNRVASGLKGLVRIGNTIDSAV